MIDLDTLQHSGRMAIDELFRKGKAPGKIHARERTPAKKELLKQSVLDAYSRTPPRFEKVHGVTRVTLPWASLDE